MHIITPVLLTLLLIIYPNALAILCARRTWDQWHAFMLGNTLLSVVLLACAAIAGLLLPTWGHASGGDALRGAWAGLIPLAVILALLYLPGSLGRDIVAAGIGVISSRRFVYRVAVQVAFTTVVCEEFLFRGLLQVLLAAVVSVRWAVGLDAAAFGLWHVMLQYNGAVQQRGVARWGAAIGGACVYALLGLVLAVVRQVTGGLLAAIVAHGVLDVCMFAGMYVRRRHMS